MGKTISRRDFLHKSSLSVGMAGIPGLINEYSSQGEKVRSEIPKRRLGRAGFMVSRIGFGGGTSFCERVTQEKQAEKLIEHAVKLGITYFDTSIQYGENSLSEKRFGKYLTPKYRDKIFLASKTSGRTYDEVMNDFESTFMLNLETDYFDLYYMHAITNMEDVKKLSSPSNGGYKAFRELKDSGIITNIGFSFHINWGDVIKEAIEQFHPDVIMCPLNASRSNGCEEHLLPIAREKNIDIVAMKVTAQNALVGNVTAKDLLRYTLSLPVAVVNVDMDGVDTLESCVKIAKEPLITPKERESIHKKLSYDSKIHKLPYIQPYIDGTAT